MSNPQCFYVHIIFTAFYMVYFQCFICVQFQAWHLSLFRQDEWRVELWNLKTRYDEDIGGNLSF